MNHWQNKSLKDIEGEVWKPINNYEGLYMASNMGRIKSLPRTAPVLRGGSRIVHAKILTRRPNVRGYIRIELSKIVDGRQVRKIFSVHRLIAETFISNPNGKPTVNHLNTITWDNRVSNLEWATQSEQVQYAASHGNRPLGINAPQAKFTDQVIEEVKRLGKEGHDYKEIASLYNMSISYAHALIGGRCRYDKHNNTNILPA
jgi:hypothetical protein